MLKINNICKQKYITNGVKYTSHSYQKCVILNEHISLLIFERNNWIQSDQPLTKILYKSGSVVKTCDANW